MTKKKTLPKKKSSLEKACAADKLKLWKESIEYRVGQLEYRVAFPNGTSWFEGRMSNPFK